MPQIQVTDYVKGLRESLELAQYIGDLIPGINATLLRRRLQEVIDELDKHRPLGPDGKHGFLHTRTADRRGRGRPQIGRPVSVRLPDRWIARLDHDAEAAGVERPELIRALIAIAYDTIGRDAGLAYWTV